MFLAWSRARMLGHGSATGTRPRQPEARGAQKGYPRLVVVPSVPIRPSRGLPLSRSLEGLGGRLFCRRSRFGPGPRRAPQRGSQSNGRPRDTHTTQGAPICAVRRITRSSAVMVWTLMAGPKWRIAVAGRCSRTAPLLRVVLSLCP